MSNPWLYIGSAALVTESIALTGKCPTLTNTTRNLFKSHKHEPILSPRRVILGVGMTWLWVHFVLGEWG